MNDATTRDREINALVALNKYLLCDTLIVITKDARETLHVGDMTIEVIPIWEYLLEEVR
jgi:predicted AAA+ superfamily ATPase